MPNPFEMPGGVEGEPEQTPVPEAQSESPENKVEQGKERIPTRDEVVEKISKYSENAVVSRELADAEDLFLLEADAPGEAAGEVNQYAYMRKGKFSSHETTETAINIVYYQDGMPVGGNNLSRFKGESGEWEEA